MAQIHNADIIKSIIDKAKIQTSRDRVPSVLAEKVIAVLEVTPERLIKIATGTVVDAYDVVIHTTHATKNTYIVGAHLSLSKDVVNDGNISNINITPFGDVSKSILSQIYEPLTAGQFAINISFIHPIKLSKNSQITVGNAASTASIDATGIIFYYETEDA